MLKNKKTILAILLLPFVILGLRSALADRITEVDATGILTVDTGVPNGDPIFVVHNMLPGDCTNEKNITVQNSADVTKTATVRSLNIVDLNNLSSVLGITINEGATNIYDDTLTQFFIDSGSLDGIPLTPVSPGETKVYTFEVCFDKNAGNEFQNTEVIFDLIFGDKISPFKLPPECAALTGKITKVIEGTDGSDRIHGSSASELIISYNGNDRIDGSSGDDCIVVGDGNNRVDATSGDDIVLTGNGNNRVDTGSGNDFVYTGSGNDRIDLGPGEDTAYSGAGNDHVNGGPGNDHIYGESGNDKLYGDAGNDYLDGGADTDRLYGNAGTDTCADGEHLSSCEL